MHVASVIIFDGPPPTHEEFRDHIESRLHLVPRFRQKLRFVPFDQGRPVWVDDPHLNLDYHVRQTALPAPGSEEQLRNLASRIFSQQLDRSKPLWELWLVEGLEGDRFAIVGKSHHALVDGVSGVDITTVLFDLEDDPPAAAPAAAEMGPAARADRPRSARATRSASASPARTEIVRGVPRAPCAGRARCCAGIGATGKMLEAGDVGDRAPRSTSTSAPTAGSPSSAPTSASSSGSRTPTAARSTTSSSRWSTGALGNYLRARGHETDGPRAAGDGPGQRPRRRGTRRARQPDLGDDGAAPGLVRGPGRAPPHRQRDDGRPEGVRPGGRRRDPDQADRLRADDDRLAGGAPAARAALLQPRRHQRPGAAVPALRARAPDGVDLPAGAARPPSGALRRDHVLRRQHRLRPRRRLRRDGRPRQLRPRPRGGDRRNRRRRRSPARAPMPPRRGPGTAPSQSTKCGSPSPRSTPRSGTSTATRRRSPTGSAGPARAAPSSSSFPSSCIPGYPAEDLYLKRHFVEAGNRAVQELAGDVTGIVALVGFAEPAAGDDGYRQAHNALAVLADGASARSTASAGCRTTRSSTSSAISLPATSRRRSRSPRPGSV